MNILQLAKYYPPIYGGIELVEKMITKAYTENNDKVFICAFSEFEKSEFGEFNENILRIKEKINILGAPFSLSFFNSFKKYIIKNKIEKIYVHLPNPFMHEVIHRYSSFLKENRIKVIGVYHSDIVNKFLLGDIYSFYFLKTSYIYDQILVSSKQLWNSSKVLSKINLAKQLVIPFCIEEGPRLKQDYTFKKKLISIGRLVPYKGFEFLIKSINNTEYDLHIVGDGPLRDKLRKISNSNIHFHHNLGHLEKNKLLADSDLLIIGSINRAEAYGMSIVESFSQAIPVVAPKLNTGVNFLVQNEITGMVYTSENTSELLDCINKLEQNTNLYQKISKSCHEFFDDQLTYKKFKESLIKL